MGAFSLEKVKAIKNKYNATINDILTAAFAGGVRKYIMSQTPNQNESQMFSKDTTDPKLPYLVNKQTNKEIKKNQRIKKNVAL